MMRPLNAIQTLNKLPLGRIAVLATALTAGYGWMVEFEKSKPALCTGVVL